MIFADPSDVKGAYIEISSPGDIKHLLTVLRLKEGAKLDVSDGAQWEYSCEIAEISKGLVRLKILDKQSFSREPELSVTLYQGVPKADKLDTIVRRCTELGAKRIVPVFMERSVVSDKGGFSKREERLRRIAEEASKQCRRGVVPEISPAKSFRDILGELSDYELLVFAYENEEKRSIKELLQGFGGFKKQKSAALIIGPEGGFSAEEAEAIEKSGARAVSLGRTILRTETAGPAALAMLMYELEL